nr:winged helix-turn-helix transcriptional regulator [Bacteroidales bacterium]
VYSNRIEILSRGTLAPNQTMEGFYLGESIPVNQKLSDIFLQLHISERSGRGVPKIIDTYGKDVFDFRENSIVVNIPFNRINRHIDYNVGDKVVNKIPLNPRRKRILEEIRNNPNITQIQLMQIIGIGKTAMQNNINFLKEYGYIERIGSNKAGYWNIKLLDG